MHHNVVASSSSEGLIELCATAIDLWLEVSWCLLVQADSGGSNNYAFLLLLHTLALCLEVIISVSGLPLACIVTPHFFGFTMASDHLWRLEVAFLLYEGLVVDVPSLLRWRDSAAVDSKSGLVISF